MLVDNTLINDRKSTNELDLTCLKVLSVAMPINYYLENIFLYVYTLYMQHIINCQYYLFSNVTNLFMLHFKQDSFFAFHIKITVRRKALGTR